MVIYICVARWYQRRRMDEDYEVHAVVKATYDRIFENRQEEQYSESTFTVTDVFMLCICMCVERYVICK